MTATKTILVTGAAGDIGAAAARRMAKDGARIVITDRKAGDLEALAAELRAAGTEARAIACDQTDPAAVTALFAAIADFAPLGGAFINAGYGRYGTLIDMDFDQWKRHVDVNLNGGFLMSTGAARAMAGQGGAIVINASTAASHVCDQLGAYAASKAGLAMLARSLASELGGLRIRVNTILPGVITTSMTRSLLDDPATHADVLSETPAGRLGNPDDIAELVAFLLSDAAGYITGAEILVDGGQTIHGYPRWFRSDYADPGSGWTRQAVPR